MARRKVKNGEKNPWGQCLTRPVPKCRFRSGFWLVPENFCVSLPNQKAASLWVVSCVLTRNDIWSSVGGKDGVVVRALASHHFDTGTDPCAYAICGCWGSCWFSPLLRDVFLWVHRSVPLSLKTNISKFQFNQESSRWRTTNRSGCAASKSLLSNLFKCRSVPGLMIYVGPS